MRQCPKLAVFFSHQIGDGTPLFDGFLNFSGLLLKQDGVIARSLKQAGVTGLSLDPCWRRCGLSLDPCHSCGSLIWVFAGDGSVFCGLLLRDTFRDTLRDTFRDTLRDTFRDTLRDTFRDTLHVLTGVPIVEPAKK